jgi:sugar phosphate isomerase/epimerase
MAGVAGVVTDRCPLGVNGGEYPHWSVSQICDLAVKVGAAFVELSAARVTGAGAAAVLQEARSRGLAVHVDAMVSALPAAFAAARAVEAPFVVAVDDAIERADLGRRASLDVFRRLARELLDAGGCESIRLALENSVIRITRQPEDLLAVVAAVDHPRFGVNFDADNFYNAGIEPFPYAYELLHRHVFHVHVKDSGRYIPAVHGDGRRVLHRAGGNVVCLPVGTGAVNWTGLIARFRRDGYRGPVSLEPHMLPHEMAPGMEADAAFLRGLGWVR